MKIKKVIALFTSSILSTSMIIPTYASVFDMQEILPCESYEDVSVYDNIETEQKKDEEWDEEYGLEDSDNEPFIDNQDMEEHKCCNCGCIIQNPKPDEDEEEDNGYICDECEIKLTKEDLQKDVKELATMITDAQSLKKDSRFTMVFPETREDMENGDIMVLSDAMYIFVWLSDEIYTWYEIKDNGIEETPNLRFNEYGKYYRVKKVTASYSIPDSLVATQGDTLGSIKLPHGFTWQKPDKVLDAIGQVIGLATYMPDNLLLYKPVYNIELKVTVNKQVLDFSYPEAKYSLSYFDGISLNDIKLPDGWEFENPNTKLDVGSKIFTAYFNADENYDYSSSIYPVQIRVDVEKSFIFVDDIYIEVPAGTMLTNEVLPKINNGTLEWDISQKIATFPTSYNCHFIPNDLRRYHMTKNIPVHISVLSAFVREETSSKDKTDDVINDNVNTKEDEMTDIKNENGDDKSSLEDENKKDEVISEKDKETDKKDEVINDKNEENNSDKEESSFIIISSSMEEINKKWFENSLDITPSNKNNTNTEKPKTEDKKDESNESNESNENNGNIGSNANDNTVGNIEIEIDSKKEEFEDITVRCEYEQSSSDKNYAPIDLSKIPELIIEELNNINIDTLQDLDSVNSVDTVIKEQPTTQNTSQGSTSSVVNISNKTTSITSSNTTTTKKSTNSTTSTVNSSSTKKPSTIVVNSNITSSSNKKEEDKNSTKVVTSDEESSKKQITITPVEKEDNSKTEANKGLSSFTLGNNNVSNEEDPTTIVNNETETSGRNPITIISNDNQDEDSDTNEVIGINGIQTIEITNTNSDQLQLDDNVDLEIDYEDEEIDEEEDEDDEETDEDNEEEKNDDEKPSSVTLIVGIAAIIGLIGLAVFMVIKRKRQYSDD